MSSTYHASECGVNQCKQLDYSPAFIRAIFGGLGGTVKGPDEEDYYELARAFPIAYSSENDPAVVEDMTEAAKELKDTKTNTPETEKKDDEDEAEDASSEDDSGADDEAGWGDIEDDNTPASRKGKQKKSKNIRENLKREFFVIRNNN